MTVIVANDAPPAIRGVLKRWFIEPKPNVFVGTFNRQSREKTMEYIRRNGKGIGMLIIHSDPNCQGFSIETMGEPDRRSAYVSGLCLVAEQWTEEETNLPSKTPVGSSGFSPHAWGWSAHDDREAAFRGFPHTRGDGPNFNRSPRSDVFPTRVGMVRNRV